MDNNFMDIAEKIDQRRSKVIKALIREAEAMDKVEITLNKHYKERVKSVLNGLIDNMEVQGNELFKEFKKSNDSLRLSLIKTRKMLLVYLLPIALLIGVTIGILGTLYLKKSIESQIPPSTCKPKGKLLQSMVNDYLTTYYTIKQNKNGFTLIKKEK